MRHPPRQGENDAAMDTDYLVIGAGSAGCAVAARLAESGARVTLLEAGPKDRHPWIHIPAGMIKLLQNQKLVNWGYTTEPEKGANDREIRWPRGRTLGGSSAINGLLYVRGQHADYDHWRQLGCTGWSFEDVLPYFRLSEDQERGASDLHGKGGPLAVSDLRERNPLALALFAHTFLAPLDHAADLTFATAHAIRHRSDIRTLRLALQATDSRHHFLASVLDGSNIGSRPLGLVLGKRI